MNSAVIRRKDELQLGRQINVVLDVKDCNFDLVLVKHLIELDKQQFPYFLRRIYILNADIPRLLEDTKTRAQLKEPELRETVFVLPEQYKTEESTSFPPRS